MCEGREVQLWKWDNGTVMWRRSTNCNDVCALSTEIWKLSTVWNVWEREWTNTILKLWSSAFYTVLYLIFNKEIPIGGKEIC